MERIIGGKYKLGRKIGSGSFGEIFLGLCHSHLYSFGFKIDSYLTFLVLLFSAATHVDTYEIVAVKIVSLSYLIFLFLFGSLLSELMLSELELNCLLIRSSWIFFFLG